MSTRNPTTPMTLEHETITSAPGLCGRALHTVFGCCTRQGRPEYGGRCWQHRAPTEDERAAQKAKRMREQARMVVTFDVRDAKNKFQECSDKLIEDLISSPQSLSAKVIRARVAKLVTLKTRWEEAVHRAEELAKGQSE